MHVRMPFVLMKSSTFLNVLFPPPPPPHHPIATFSCHFLAILLLGYHIPKEYIVCGWCKKLSPCCVEDP